MKEGCLDCFPWKSGQIDPPYTIPPFQLSSDTQIYTRTFMVNRGRYFLSFLNHSCSSCGTSFVKYHYFSLSNKKTPSKYLCFFPFLRKVISLFLKKSQIPYIWRHLFVFHLRKFVIRDKKTKFTAYAAFMSYAYEKQKNINVFLDSIVQHSL